MALGKSTAEIDVQINGITAGKSMKSLEDDVKRLRKEIKDLTPGTEEFRKKLDEVGEAKGKLESVNKIVRGFRDELKGTKDELSGASKIFGAFGIDIKKYSEGMEEFAEKGGLAGKAVGGLNTAFKILLTNPILLVITLIVAAFVKLASATDTVKDRIEQFSKGFSTVFDLLVNGVEMLITTGEGFSGFGDAIKNVFNIIITPAKNFIDLLGGLGKALLNLVKGDYKGAADAVSETANKIKQNQDSAKESGKQLADGFVNLTDKIKGAYNAGVEYADTLQKIEDAEDELNVQRAETDRLVTRALIQAKNKTLSYKEQIGLLDYASQLEIKTSKQEIDLARQKLEAIQKYNRDRATGKEKQLTDEQKNEERAAQITLSNALKNQDNLLEKIQNRRDAADEKEADRRQKEFEKAREAALDAAAKEADALEKFAQEQEKKRQKALQTKTLSVPVNELPAVKEFKIADAEISELQKQSRQSSLEAAKKAADEEAAYRLKTLQKNASLIAGFASQAISAFADFSKIASDKQISDSEKVKNERTKKLDAELKAKKITQDQYNNAIAAGEAEFAEKSRQLKRKQAEKEKVATIAEAIAAGALAVIKALPNIPLSILAGVTAGLNIAKIIATPVPTFARGGVAQGAMHSEGGIDLVDRKTGRITGNMEGGEPYMILSRNTYANNRGIIDSLLHSSLYRNGARVYADGGVTNPSAVPNPTDNSTELMLILIGKVEELTQAVEGFEGRLRVVYQDIEETGSVVVTSRNNSSFS